MSTDPPGMLCSDKKSESLPEFQELYNEHLYIKFLAGIKSTEFSPWAREPSFSLDCMK